MLTKSRLPLFSDEIQFIGSLRVDLPEDVLGLIFEYSSEKLFRQIKYEEHVIGVPRELKPLPTAFSRSFAWEMIRRVLYIHATMGFTTWDKLGGKNAIEWAIGRAAKLCSLRLRKIVP